MGVEMITSRYIDAVQNTFLINNCKHDSHKINIEGMSQIKQFGVSIFGNRAQKLKTNFVVMID